MQKYDRTFKFGHDILAWTEFVIVDGYIGLALIDGIDGMLVTMWFKGLPTDSDPTDTSTCLSRVKVEQLFSFVWVALKSRGLLKRIISSSIIL